MRLALPPPSGRLHAAPFVLAITRFVFFNRRRLYPYPSSIHSYSPIHQQPQLLNMASMDIDKPLDEVRTWSTQYIAQSR